MNKPRPLISLCMIAYNEENQIYKVLTDVKRTVDEIIIVNNGSTDRTADIIRAYTKQGKCKIINDNTKGDFSYLRNLSLQHATGIFCLALDADDRISKYDRLALRKLCEKYSNQGKICFEMQIKNVRENKYNEGSFRSIRAWRNHPEARFKNIIHEDISTQLVKLDYTKIQTDIEICHWGYFTNIDAEKSALRNFPLLEKELQENPNNFVGRFIFANNYYYSKDFEKAYDNYVYIFNNGRELSKTNPEVWAENLIQITYCLFHSGDYNEGLELLTEALKIDKTNKRAWLVMAKLFFVKEDYPACLTTLDIYDKCIDNKIRVLDYSKFVMDFEVIALRKESKKRIENPPTDQDKAQEFIKNFDIS